VRRASGATLVELLVAISVLGVIAVLSAQLVIQATKLMNTAARASLNPELVLAGEWLRRDVYRTVAVPGIDLTWFETPLVLTIQGGGTVSFGPSHGELVRTELPPGGGALDRRAIVGGVVGWRWRVDDGRVLEIEISSYANPHAHRNLAGRMTVHEERQTERLVLALRGRPGGRAW